MNMLQAVPGFNAESFLKFAANPSETSYILDVQKGLVNAPNRKELIQHTYKAAMSDPEFVALFNEKYIPRFPTNAELLAFPEGSLGRETGLHLERCGIQLDFSGIDVSVFYNMEMNIIGYLNVRGIRTHDIYHTVLGLGVTPIDEYALASFTLAQYASPYHMLLVASGYIHTTFHAPQDIPKFLTETHRFYELGRNAKSFLGFRYEDHFGTPLSEVRAMLGVQEV